MPLKTRSPIPKVGNSTISARSRPAAPKRRAASQKASVAADVDTPSDSDFTAARPAKKRRVTASRNDAGARLGARLFNCDDDVAKSPTCTPPVRLHAHTYHRPLLLQGTSARAGRKALLGWYDSVSTARCMPWRKPWINPADIPDAAERRRALERRAYEVWISEIMLQQTRVAVVIDYWNSWMAKWPTIQDLAAADGDDVLAAWRGLGYYSRATRIHEAAKAVVADGQMQGLLPSSARELEAKVSGVGRYTAGAISAIVFGQAEPMVDGNVLRVLSRQTGILGNVKSDKAVIDVLWAAADALAKAVAGDGDEVDQSNDISDRPGRWGQALMELGSTICTPTPRCAQCPISSTCRAYSEGEVLASKQSKGAAARRPPDDGPAIDMEDLCTLCENLEDDEGKDEGGLEPKPDASALAPKRKAAKQATLTSFAFKRDPIQQKAKVAADSPRSQVFDDAIVNHAKRFPIKAPKIAVREEETLVCAIRRRDGRYLIHRRPEKGLLAGLWEFPSRILGAGEDASPERRNELAREHVDQLVGGELGYGRGLSYAGELGSVPWLFSHLKLTMHVHLFTVDGEPESGGSGEADGTRGTSRWTDDVESESMGTGMRKCVALVNNAVTKQPLGRR